MRKILNRILNILNTIIPKSDKIILLYSGVEYKDNIKAMGDFLYENKYDEKYHIILGEYQRTDKFAIINGKKVFIHNKLVSVLYFLRAKYVMYAFNPIYIKPSRNQIVFQMWHGMPLKSIFNHGKEVKNDYDFFSYILATSPLFKKIISECVPCDDKKVILLGQPKTDSLCNRKLIKEDKKIVFWAPTFRKAKYWNQTDLELTSLLPLVPDSELNNLNNYLSRLNIKLVVKLHPMESCDDNLNIIMDNVEIYSHKSFCKKGYELYSFLGISDALITDYSSTYMDYLLVNKPIGFIVDSIDEYSKNRGFIFNNPFDYMPGDKVCNLEDLYFFFDNLGKGNDNFIDERRRVDGLFNTFDRSVSNCQQLADFMGIKK